MIQLKRNYPLATSTIFLNSFLAGGYQHPEPTQKIYPPGVIAIDGFICSESLDRIKAQFLQALENVSVEKIYFLVNSPGGDVGGVDELSGLIYSKREVKPSVAMVKEACSAAYWLASAASQVLLEGKTSMCGSIGVIAVHDDISEALKMQGIGRTELFAGEFKTAGTSSKPLDSVGKKELQDKVEYFYNLFLKAVSRNRNIPFDRVDRTAKIFVGMQCIENNLADSFMYKGDSEVTPEEIQKMKEEIELLRQENARLQEELGKLKEPAKAESVPMEEKKEEQPSLEGKCKSEGEEQKPEEEKKVEEVVAKAIAAERERIMALDSICIPGFEETIAKAKVYGTSPQAVSFEILKAQTKNRVYALKAESKTLDFGSGMERLSDEEKRKQMAAMIAKSGKGVK